MNKLLISSDHHANWDALEYWFSYASKNKLPFIIPGDVVGDYNFEELAYQKGVKFPEILLEDEDNGVLRKLFNDIVKFHAKKLAGFIDKYKVKTYFLHGNHEPIYFGKEVISYLKQKELFVDMNEHKGFIQIGDFKVAGISNTNQLMPYLYSVFKEDELDLMFKHQRTARPVILGVSKESLTIHPDPVEDFDWLRIMSDNNDELDIFITHGQIGRGAWRKEKFASELPTLVSAAKLSLLSKITVDGHLHTTHTMKNVLGKPTIRAVGNKAFVVEKVDGELFVEELDSGKEYDARGKISLEDLDELKSPIDKLLES
ncbi:MAG: metallophosphoesterase [Candidatus Woesearchaeota archaeon]